MSFLLVACSQESSPDATENLFSSLDSAASHIDFANRIQENDTLNYFTFPYLYLGGGVAAGDINNDGLPDLYFTGNQVSNKLYLNQGNGEFTDITEAAGVGGDSRWYSGVTMVDINHDGWLDIYVSVSGKWNSTANQLFINQGNETFLEQAEAYGIADESISIQSTFFDYNNDGHLDLFVANYPVIMVSRGNRYYKNKMDQNRFEDSGHLYKNNGDGTFTDVTDAAGVRRFGLTLGLLAADFNEDGFQDLYLSNDFNVPDYLYQNNGDGTFSEVSKEAMRHTSMFGMGIDAADFNNDGNVDLIQLDMTPEDYKRSKTNMASMQPASFFEAVDMGFNYQYMQNTLQLNNGVGPEGYPLFSDVSRLAGVSNTDWSWGVLGADFDNDGWKDVFITNGVKRDVNNNDVHEQYESATFFGGDGNRDFRQMPSTPISNYAFHNQGDHTFTNQTKAWGLDEKGFSNGCVVVDLDLDGDLDLVLNNLDDVASIYLNQAQDSENQSLSIKLKGPETNPLGLGATVTINTASLEQVQQLTLTRGYQSSMNPLLHFGVGTQAIVEEIAVHWPDGSFQRLSDISPDQILTIDYQEAKKADRFPSLTQAPFQDITQRQVLPFTHQEDEYDDYQLEPLLPHKNSQIGPALAVGDVNGDGLDDFFVGNAAGQQAAMFVQGADGQFSALSGPWEDDARFEDTGALLFDADGDKDLDLYVVNGGNDGSQSTSYYQDRLYIQTEGGFQKVTSSLPNIQTSGATVVSTDYDGDGDADLFVGGRIVPGKYPFPATSHILRNDGGKDLSIRYTDVTQELAPELLEAGLVTAALWEDFDADGKIDLI
ncbi:MAG: VCBS repeat-containing protein, partial [Bacteroidota bacterium]